MHPFLNFYWPAIIVAYIAAFAFGGAWYSFIAVKPWMEAMGMDPNAESCKNPDPVKMKRSFALQILGLALTVFVISHEVQIWRPSVWNAAAQDTSSWTYGFLCGFFTWLGFYVPLQLNKVSWENRPMKLFWINTAHDFIYLQIISQILANWRGL